MKGLGPRIAIAAGAAVVLVAYGVWFTMDVFPPANRGLTMSAFIAGGLAGFGLYWLLWRLLFRRRAEKLTGQPGMATQVLLVVPVVALVPMLFIFPFVAGFFGLSAGLGGSIIAFITWHPYWRRSAV